MIGAIAGDMIGCKASLDPVPDRGKNYSGGWEGRDDLVPANRHGGGDDQGPDSSLHEAGQGPFPGTSLLGRKDGAPAA